MEQKAKEAGLDQPRRSKRSIKVWIIAVCIIAISLLLIAVAVAVGITLGTRPSVIPSSILDRLASDVRSNMDTSADPCQDFYRYSCGGWERKYPQATSFNRFAELNLQNIQLLRNVIEGGRDGDVPAVRLAKQFYDSCMNTRLLDGMGSQPLLQLVRATGGWDLINVSNSKLILMMGITCILHGLAFLVIVYIQVI